MDDNGGGIPCRRRIYNQQAEIAVKVDKHKESMHVRDNPHPGLEQDSEGKPIPMEERLPEDRQLAKRKTGKKAAD